MAYLMLHDDRAIVTAPLAPLPAVQAPPALPDAGAPLARFSALEWSVVALARKDRLSSLRRPGRMAAAMAIVFKQPHNPMLADDRLEALRRMAVLGWHHGYTVPSDEVTRFVDAGFLPAQYELLMDSIGVARRNAARRR